MSSDIQSSHNNHNNNNNLHSLLHTNISTPHLTSSYVNITPATLVNTSTNSINTMDSCTPPIPPHIPRHVSLPPSVLFVPESPQSHMLNTYIDMNNSVYTINSTPYAYVHNNNSNANTPVYENSNNINLLNNNNDINNTSTNNSSNVGIAMMNRNERLSSTSNNRRLSNFKYPTALPRMVSSESQNDFTVYSNVLQENDNITNNNNNNS
jgi:hypothetical protein